MSASNRIIQDFKNYIELLPKSYSWTNREEIISKIENRANEINDYQKTLEKNACDSFKKEFQDNILPLTNKSDLCHYCYEKPRGYAGDFFAMEKIWHGRIDKSQCELGSDTTGKVLNAFTLESPNCKANEYRIGYFSDIIKSYNNSNIASIGCGSAIEIEEFFRADKTLGNNNFYLLDQDKGALDLIREKLPDSNNINLCHGNVLRQIIKFDKDIKFDFIYSSGMFDYLPLHQAQKVTKNLFDLLKKGGKLIITNAHPDNPSRFWMEYTMNWYLDYKNSEEMMMIPDLIDDKKLRQSIFMDDFNVYQYLHIEKL